MLIDHMGEIFFPNTLWMRYIGRLAFPIYAFLIAEGFRHTKNINRYLARLFAFACISEVPFDLATDGVILSFDYQNVYFTLFLGLLTLRLMELSGEDIYLKVLIMASLSLLAQSAHTDYRYIGIWMIFMFDRCRRYPLFRAFAVSSINLRLSSIIQWSASLALIPISMYNGRRGPSWKYFFYAFYPLHLLVLYFIRKYVFG